MSTFVCTEGDSLARMARRIDVELTSTRDDGTWTWRAAGAKQPKGELSGSLLWDGAAIGDECKVEAEFHLDGIEVLEVFAPKAKSARTDLLEMISRPLRDDELVTEVRAKRDRSEGRGRRDGRGRDGKDRDGRGKGGRGRDGGGRDQQGKDGRPRTSGGDRPRDRKPKEDARPRPKRLRAQRVHRDAVLADLPEEHRPIAHQVLKGGLPAVRTATKGQENAGAIMAIAENLAPRLHTAEWQDRADAALAEMSELDLRDLRSVVVASDSAAKDEATRALAEQLRDGLNQRIDSDHAEWLADLQRATTEERTVRALRISSRPVKAGFPIPTEIAEKLVAAASAALNNEISQDRFATVLDAVAFSPIRGAVKPASFHAEPSKELLEAVRAAADKLPEIAAHFGIDPSEAAAARKRRRPARAAAKKQQQQKQPAKPKKPARPHPGSEPKPDPEADAAAEETVPTEEAAAETPPVEEAPSPVADAEPVPADPAPEEAAPEVSADTEVSADEEE